MDARGLCGVIVALVTVPALSVAADAVPQDHLTCSSIVQDTVRLACYDEASKEADPEPAAAAEIQQEVAAVDDAPPKAAPVEVAEVSAESVAVDDAPQKAAPVEVAEVAEVSAESVAVIAASATPQERVTPLTDDVGLSSVERDDPEEQQIIRGTVTSCRLGASGKHLFYFDNGQVWKQSGTSRKKYEDCEFEASIMRDAFGYRMLPDGETQRIRITRVR